MAANKPTTTTFPVRFLDKSVFLTLDFPDLGMAVRMGWRAPLFVFLPQVDGPVAPGSDRSVGVLDITGRLMGERRLTFDDISGGWDGITDFGKLDLPLIKRALSTSSEDAQKKAFFQICQLADARSADVDCPWQDFLKELERDRFEASAWFERDRRNLSLTDNVTGDTVVSLWDDDVDEAIESGYLSTPRVPRASDSDWLNPLKAYADEYGLIPSLRAQPAQPADQARSRP
jgi:hypothetical protein